MTSLAPTFVTPSQTVGPFFEYALPYESGTDVAAPHAPGAFVLHGRVVDGNGNPVPDALIEIWQAGPDGALATESGIYSSPGQFRGFGRCGSTTRDVTGSVRSSPAPSPPPTGEGRPPISG